MASFFIRERRGNAGHTDTKDREELVQTEAAFGELETGSARRHQELEETGKGSSQSFQRSMTRLTP